MRFLTRALLALAMLLVLVIGAGAVALLGSLPELDGEAPGPGLSADAVIERDALGVVTITAQSRADVAFATGYVHAQDRWFQMDLARRASSGRLAELLGDAALDADARHRLHGFAQVAGEVLATLPDGDRALLQAYADGVNAGLESLHVRPFEYLLLRRRPEPWQPADSLLVVYTMYLQLNDAEAAADRQRGLLAAALPPEALRYVYSVAPDWEAPIDGDVVAAAPMPLPEAFDLRRYATGATGRTPLATPRTGHEPRALGSNNWAVGGALTATGAGLVANDMHLGLGVPNTWYRVRLLVAGPEARQDLRGLTLAGAPILTVGSTGRIAWGFTNSYGDWSDLALVELSPDGSSYRGRAGWTPLERRTERVRSGSGQERTVTIERTEWGPLLPPVAGDDSARHALAWTAHRPEATNLEWLRLEHAADCAEALGIANTVGGPVQNFVCADAAGGIGWSLLGRMPNRASGHDAGQPADWTAEGSGWTGWQDPATYPRVLDPASGRLWTANNRVVGGAALAAIGDGSPDRGARAQQIRDALLLLGEGAATERDMLAIQLDDRALFLGRWRARLLELLDRAALDGEPAREAWRAQVEAWEPRASVDSVGYRLVRGFHEAFERRVFDALILPARQAHPGFEFKVPRQFEQAAWDLANVQPVHLLDPAYPSWRALLLATVDEAIREASAQCGGGDFSNCAWGEVNATRIQHPLSRGVPALARWLDMPRVPMAGDHDMPNVHVPGFGASERFAVSPGHEDRGYYHMPGGQSGHPLSRHYRAGHEAWVRGEPQPFLPGPAEHTLTLRREPARPLR